MRGITKIKMIKQTTLHLLLGTFYIFILFFSRLCNPETLRYQCYGKNPTKLPVLDVDPRWRSCILSMRNVRICLCSVMNYKAWYSLLICSYQQSSQYFLLFMLYVAKLWDKYKKASSAIYHLLLSRLRSNYILCKSSYSLSQAY